MSCEKAENEVSFDVRRAVFGAMMMMADAIVSDVEGGLSKGMMMEVDAMDNRSNDHPPGLACLVGLAMRMQRYLIGDPRPQLTNARNKLN